MNKTLVTFFYFIVLVSAPVKAEIHWWDVNFSAWHGKNFEVGSAKRNTLTVEGAFSSSWGDFFGFMDKVNYDGGSSDWYGEFSPRFSLKKLNLIEMKDNRLFSDLSIATSIEWSSEDMTNQLLGLGTDVNIPGIKVVQFMIYRRFNEHTRDNWQITPVWIAPFMIADTNFLLDGFIDWTSSATNIKSSFHFSTQLKLDIGQFYNYNYNNKLYIGIRYELWRNKFGIENDLSIVKSNENNLTFIIKWHI